ncbi:AMP-binding protein [Nonomuraea sp. B12E4]|uniref:class I adenylate-forming enzyme family protein n=1 Tax=Nonomuraea sp. B12E4 TaxID=3153564 RepID=UPI00325CC89B
MHETIPELMRHAARTYGAREFLRCNDTSLTFAEADERSDLIARGLVAWGVRPGDRVAIMLDNVSDWPLTWLGVLKAGAVAVPVNTRYQAADLAHVLRDSGSARTVTNLDYASINLGGCSTPDFLTYQQSHLVPDTPTESHDVANFQYTSGTTGFPKACMLTHDFFLRTAQIIADQVNLRDDDVMIMAQAYSYLDPQWATVLCLLGGVPLVVLPRFSASGFWASVREHRATLTYVLGSMPLLLHKQPPHPRDRDHRMRLVICSGIRPDLHQAFEERWGAPWRELYGSTESGPDLVMPEDADGTAGTGALGVPPPGKEVELDESGEILVRGVPMMRGYWNHPEATAHAFRDGWYHTGDLGFRDAQGYIHHAGRIKDMVRRGGENISCAEVEAVLTQHPAVLQAALVPIPDELYGELPKAFLQLRPGHEPGVELAVSVVGHARERLAKFKIPAYVEFVEGFSLTPSARIEKRHLLTPERDQRAAPAIATDHPHRATAQKEHS